MNTGMAKGTHHQQIHIGTQSFQRIKSFNQHMPSTENHRQTKRDFFR